jgi:hypothetical protein
MIVGGIVLTAFFLWVFYEIKNAPIIEDDDDYPDTNKE